MIESGGEPEFRRREAAGADETGEGFHIDPGDQTSAGCEQFIVEPPDLVDRGGRRRPLRRTAVAMRRRDQPVLDDFHIFRRELPPQRLEDSHLGIQCRVHFRRVRANRQRRHQLPPVRRDNHDVWAKSVESRTGIQNVLHIGSIRSLVYDWENILPQHRAGYRPAQVVDGHGAQNRDALRGRSGR